MKNKSKIKIAAQVRPNPNVEDIAFIKELGLDYVTLFAGKGEANYDFFMKQREIFETNDLKIYGFGNSNIHNHASLVLNLNDRDEVIEDYKNYIRDLSKAGIFYSTYAHMANGVWSTAKEPTRGGAIGRAFDLNAETFYINNGQTISKKELTNIETKAIPGPGSCGGMYTANTMASAIEALGMSLPYNSSNPAISKEKINECSEIGESIKNLIEKDIKPSDIVTKKSLENALRLVTVLGGSTNAVLHFLAISRAANLDLSIDYFQEISDSTPYLANLKPSGKYLMKDLHKIGGVPYVLKYMLENKMLHGDCLTVTGNTLEENLSKIKSPNVSSNDLILSLIHI